MAKLQKPMMRGKRASPGSAPRRPARKLAQSAMPGSPSSGGGDQPFAVGAPSRQAAPGMPPNVLFQAKPIRVVGDREEALQCQVPGDVEMCPEHRTPRSPWASRTLPSIGGAGGALAATQPDTDAIDFDAARIFRAWECAARSPDDVTTQIPMPNAPCCNARGSS